MAGLRKRVTVGPIRLQIGPFEAEACVSMSSMNSAHGFPADATVAHQVGQVVAAAAAANIINTYEAIAAAMFTAMESFYSQESVNRGGYWWVTAVVLTVRSDPPTTCEITR